MNKKLEVDLRVQLDGRTVVSECRHIDDDLRGKGLLAQRGEYKIYSSNYPAIVEKLLYVRGSDYQGDFMVSCKVFKSEKEAFEYLKNMNELIDEINNPTIEINLFNGDYKKVGFGDNSEEFVVDFYDEYTQLTYRKGRISIKTWYFDKSGEEGQPFDEIKVEFDLFCKNRGIKAKLVKEGE